MNIGWVILVPAVIVSFVGCWVVTGSPMVATLGTLGAIGIGMALSSRNVAEAAFWFVAGCILLVAGLVVMSVLRVEFGTGWGVTVILP